MRQINQLAIALARAMHLRQNGKFEDAIDVLRGALSDVADADLGRLLQMSRLELLDYLGDNAGLATEGQCSIADVLYEYSLSSRSTDQERSAAALERALWIYEACVVSGATLPLHVHERLESASPGRRNVQQDSQQEDWKTGEENA
ncbi:MAG: hypothetical protein KJO98_09515 [Rhodothermia bacterium]|nr:hypothetical protein [Rhodothermia bacterium]